jgi:hypothetical protein
MLAVNFHLMGGMPVRAPVRADIAAESIAAAAGTAPTESALPPPRPDAPAEVVMRRPIALQMLVSKVRESLA